MQFRSASDVMRSAEATDHFRKDGAHRRTNGLGKSGTYGNRDGGRKQCVFNEILAASVACERTGESENLVADAFHGGHHFLNNLSSVL